LPCDRAGRIALVAAVAENGVIGRNGTMPWRLRSDLRRFKALTLGHTVVMGRRTHASIGGPLPGRRTIVVTRACLEDAETTESLAEALARAGRPVFLVGGAAIYDEGMAVAGAIHLTRVHASPDGDTRFPPVDPETFACVASQPGLRGPQDDHEFTFLGYARRRAAD